MNELFPIFLKLHQVNTLLVGAGAVGLEKLQAMVSSSPNARIHLVAEEVSEGVREFIKDRKNIYLSERAFRDEDLENVGFIVLATNNAVLNQHIRVLATKQNILLNVADKPDLCDVYLGSVVQKGNLKIGISTNGKSPTMAKRLKEFLADLLPEEIDETLALMGELRDSLKGDFQEKVKALNEHTKGALKI
ncbi:precorrin-2 dehydrogenase/sirohydrochlorin ferrochelatase family protein [Sphingobacterium wenxiniae]|uniref:precorrin-2 dehydrogenase n=1 Tax=Sphingobacterium wenxiniae TaxID=683125 RepID=A0A1I6QMK7_9SPHI|nr:bifunctional precorrin-2 dehydrogenase/sirohydrochlorin ferrochelatase [Sphingobacterium wenxiniae]SFS53562.1 precorrin-2 dehydrogenase / sirohydrochlorin ferrochelatase [Sphingobacterium wenxiniae]